MAMLVRTRHGSCGGAGQGMARKGVVRQSWLAGVVLGLSWLCNVRNGEAVGVCCGVLWRVTVSSVKAWKGSQGVARIGLVFRG